MPKKTPDCARICSENLNLVRNLQEPCRICLSYTLGIVMEPQHCLECCPFLMLQDCLFDHCNKKTFQQEFLSIGLQESLPVVSKCQ